MNILFRNPKNTFGIFFVINLIVWGVTIFLLFTVVSFLLNNPDAIGEFFGKIVYGFNSTK